MTLLVIFLLVILPSCSFIEAEKEKVISEKTDLISQGISRQLSDQKNDLAENDLTKMDLTEKDESSTSRQEISGKQSCTISKTTPQFTHENYYTGPLADTHVHLPVSSKIVSTIAIQSGFEDMPAYGQRLSNGEELTVDYLSCLFTSEGITKVFGFNLIPSMTISSSVNAVEEMAEKYPLLFIPFYMPTPIDSLNPTPGDVDEILTKNTFFKGYGEVKFSFQEVKNQGIEDQKSIEYYDLAKKHNLVIMMHPAEDQKESVIRLLQKYPTVKFLFHSREMEGWLEEILADYPNAFYSLDAIFVNLYGWTGQHQQKGPTQQEFIDYFTANFNQIKQNEVHRWKGVIEKYPHQLMWGTDRWYTWHFSPEVGALLEEFGRSFIAELSPEVQDNFAYKNAQKIMEE